MEKKSKIRDNKTALRGQFYPLFLYKLIYISMPHVLKPWTFNIKVAIRVSGRGIQPLTAHSRYIISYQSATMITNTKPGVEFGQAKLNGFNYMRGYEINIVGWTLTQTQLVRFSIPFH